MRKPPALGVSARPCLPDLLTNAGTLTLSGWPSWWGPGLVPPPSVGRLGWWLSLTDRACGLPSCRVYGAHSPFPLCPHCAMRPESGLSVAS